LVTVVPVALDASAAVTRVHASTLEMSLGEGVGEGVLAEAEGDPDDPHAASSRQARAARASAPGRWARFDRVGAVAAELNCEPVVSQGDDVLSIGPDGFLVRPIESSAVPR
jgi:sarcosine oxidase gamma subunit